MKFGSMMKYLGLFMGVGSGYYLYEKYNNKVNASMLGLNTDFLAGINIY